MNWLWAVVPSVAPVESVQMKAVQGGSISPLLANIYLHYVFDLWVRQWRKTQAGGDMIVVRFADDFVAGFQHRWEAERFLAELRKRFQRFGLELHPEKTRLIEFGRFAAANRKRRGLGKPETFNFLGFTHMCGKTRKEKFAVFRRTMRQRMRAKLKAVKAELRRRMHDPVPLVGAYLRSVVAGHMRYYGVPRNGAALTSFRRAVGWLWWRTLKRRSQTGRVTLARMARLIARWLPLARICRPWHSWHRLVKTQGRSPVRQFRTPGSVRGAPGDRRPYRDRDEGRAEWQSLATQKPIGVRHVVVQAGSP